MTAPGSEEGTSTYQGTLDKLTRLSIENHYNVYKAFEWPDAIADDAMWMSPELMSVYGTPFAATLDEAKLRALGKWESINFYSLNIHGIRELIVEVTRRIHAVGYEDTSEFFHRFIGEENDHMWFFAHFCSKYAKKIYPDKSIKLQSPGPEDPLVESFFVFARILIFEEIVDYFNTKMGKDTRLDPIVQKINWFHHEDESRHISGGRQLVKRLHAELKARGDAALLTRMDEYVKRYIVTSIESLYNPSMYRDAGIPDGHALRRDLLKSPERKLRHAEILKRILGFLTSNEIISGKDFV